MSLRLNDPLSDENIVRMRRRQFLNGSSQLILRDIVLHEHIHWDQILTMLTVELRLKF